MPTCCEMLGVNPPPTVHGQSFWDAARGEVSLSREYVIAGWKRKGFYYVVDHEWRYVDNGPDHPCELYDKERDPEETHNVANEHPASRELMENRLKGFWQHAKSLNP